eukprot:UN13888
MNQSAFRKALSDITSYCKLKIGNQAETLRNKKLSTMSDCPLKR